MKSTRRFALLGFLLCLGGIMIGCTKDLSDDIDDLKNRVSSLEEQTKQINKEIETINGVITAMSGNEQVTAIEELSDKSGYKITFSKNGQFSRSIEIKNGKNGTNAPVIGAAKDSDGKYYWNQTIDGNTSWLTNDKGEKLPVSGENGNPGEAGKDGVTPVLGVDAQGYWTIDKKDGLGAQRMKDALGNDVKATGKDGVDGTPGSSGALGFSVSSDGRYAIFTISGVEYKFEIYKFTVGLQTDAYDIIYMEQGVSKTLDILLPANIKKTDFTAIKATVEGKNGGASDVVTRAVATDKWQVVLTKPGYKPDGTIDVNAKVEITAPSTAVIGDGAMLTVSVLDVNGNLVSVSRAIEIVDVTSITYNSEASGLFTLPALTDISKSRNVLVNVNANKTAAQTIYIPEDYNKDNTGIISIKFSSSYNFTIDDAVASALTINAPGYNGTIIIEGQSDSHEALKNSAVGGKALVVNAPNATVITKTIKITGQSDINVSPNTFIVRNSQIGATNITNGSLQVEAGATVKSVVSTSSSPVSIMGSVTETIETAAPLVIQGNVGGDVTATSAEAKIEVKGGTVTGAITSSAPVVVESGSVSTITTTGSDANVEVKGGTVTGEISSAAPVEVSGGTVESKITSESPVTVSGGQTKEIEANGVTVTEGAKVTGNVTSNGEAKVEIKGEVSGDVKADNATDVVIGDDAKITGDLTTNDNANVVLPPNANIGGSITVPESAANISIGSKAYPNIYSAVDAAQANEVIKLKGGIYKLTDKLLITKDITIEGSVEGGTPTAIFDGSEIAANDNALFFSNTGTAILKNIKFTGYKSNGNNGTFIMAGTNDLSYSGSLEMESCVIERFGKGGIVVKGGTLKVTKSSIDVTNYNNVINRAPNGIQVDNGATAVIENNVIFDSRSTSDNWSASGILVLRSGKITSVTGNTLTNCQIGISLSTSYDTSDDNTSMPKREEVAAQNTFNNCEVNVEDERITPWVKDAAALTAALANEKFEELKLYPNIAGGTTQFKITRPVVLKGGSISFSGTGGFICESNVTFSEGLTINASTTIGSAPITINKGDITVNVKSVILNQATAGTGDGTASSGLGIRINDTFNNITLNVIDSKLNMNATVYQRAIACPSNGQSNIFINVERTEIICKTVDDKSNSMYSQAIGIGTFKNSKITVKDSKFAGMYYPVSFAGGSLAEAADGIELIIDNSYLAGYCALNLRGNNLNITIKNKSVLVGRNFYAKGSSDFATIVFNRIVPKEGPQIDMVVNSTLTVDNSTIETFMSNTALNYPIDLRQTADNKIILKNNAKLIDKVVQPANLLDYMIDGFDSVNPKGSSVTIDNTVQLIGKDGVLLYPGYTK